jgi:hypothetical protein
MPMAVAERLVEAHQSSNPLLPSPTNSICSLVKPNCWGLPNQRALLRCVQTLEPCIIGALLGCISFYLLLTALILGAETHLGTPNIVMQRVQCKSTILHSSILDKNSAGIQAALCM